MKINKVITAIPFITTIEQEQESELEFIVLVLYNISTVDVAEKLAHLDVSCFKTLPQK